MLCRADSVGVFQVESRAQMATLAPPQAAHLLRPRRRGRAHPPGPDPGRFGAPVHPPPQRHRAGDLSAPVARERRWPRRWACRCSKSSSCRWPSTSPGSRRRGRPAAPGDGIEAQPMSAWSACANGSTTAWPTRGVSGAVADEILDKMAAFANYGFPESHSVRFAYLVYASSWLKLHEPGRVLRGVAQRAADGLLLAALARAGRPPPRRRRAHPRPQRVHGPRRSSNRARSRTTAWRCAWGSGPCDRSATISPERSQPGRPYCRSGRPRAPGAGVTSEPSRSDGHRRGVRLLRSRAP